MSRNAVARFKDPAAHLAEMTRELNIGAVLAGSVRHDGTHVRVSVQLLAAPSGEVRWSEQYDRTVSNIFDVQSDIALRVARALQLSLAPQERARIERLPTSNTAAYELYLKQRGLSTGIPERNAEGIRLLDEAIALDPGSRWRMPRARADYGSAATGSVATNIWQPSLPRRRQLRSIHSSRQLTTNSVWRRIISATSMRLVSRYNVRLNSTATSTSRCRISRS
jgi:hypothetical protein